MELSADERALLFVGIAYLFIVGVWVVTLAHSANIMLRNVRERIDASLWLELGEPDSMKAAMKDPERRWMRFVRSGEYKRRCSTEVAGLIDDYKSRTNRMLIILGVAAVAILYRFGPILMPAIF